MTTAPYVRIIEADVPAVATAASDDTVVGQAPFDCTVTKVEYVPETAVTGADTNSRTVSLVSKGQTGSGTTTVASLALTSGVNAAANDEKTVTLSGTAANLDLTAGDTLQWRSIAVGTGLADPGGLVRITVSRR
jgi:flagellar biosynthesis GTPase FlhF